MKQFISAIKIWTLQLQNQAELIILLMVSLDRAGAVGCAATGRNGRVLVHKRFVDLVADFFDVVHVLTKLGLCVTVDVLAAHC